MPVSPKTMRMVLERSGRDMPSQATAPRVVPSAPVRPPMPAQAAAPAMPPQAAAPVMPPQAAPAMPPQAAATLPPQAMGGGMPPQGMPAQAQGMPPRGPMMKRGGSVKSSSKPASKPRGVGIAQRGFGCGGKVKMR